MKTALTPFEAKAGNILFFAMLLANLSFLQAVCTIVGLLCLAAIFLSTLKRRNWLLALASILIAAWIIT